MMMMVVVVVLLLMLMMMIMMAVMRYLSVVSKSNNVSPVVIAFRFSLRAELVCRLARFDQLARWQGKNNEVRW